MPKRIFAVLYVSVMGLTRCYKTTVFYIYCYQLQNIRSANRSLTLDTAKTCPGVYRVPSGLVQLAVDVVQNDAARPAHSSVHGAVTAFFRLCVCLSFVFFE